MVLIFKCSIPCLHMWVPQCVVKKQKIVLSICILCKFQSYCYCSSASLLLMLKATAHFNSNAATKIRTRVKFLKLLEPLGKFKCIPAFILHWTNSCQSLCWCWVAEVLESFRHLKVHIPACLSTVVGVHLPWSRTQLHLGHLLVLKEQR